MNIERGAGWVANGEGDRHPLPDKPLEPLGQGELDGLCGLYSAINGLRLLARDQGKALDWDQCQRLFRAGIEMLDAEDRLAHGAYRGMSLSTWRRLIDRLAGQAERMMDCPVWIERPFAPRQRVPAPAAWETIRSAIEMRRPVLLLLRGAYDHFTVATALSGHRLVLFDSYGFRWVTRASCSIGATRPYKRHQLAPSSITILRAEPRHAGA
jgi:hypothetical protein